MSNRRTSRASKLTATGSLECPKPLTLKAAQRIRMYGRILDQISSFFNGVRYCGAFSKGESRNVFARRKDLSVEQNSFQVVDPRNAISLTDFGSPPIPTRAFVLKKGDFFPISLCSNESSKNLAERGGESLLIFRGPVWVGLALDSATSSGLGRAPALQCRTPSRHHLELQDRRDYTPADRAARTCWLGCPGLLYDLAA
ncbi:hypothetical protein TNCV_4689521 [Trichonephila clavipes]|nr:hypothetical protein TNCV_4689521 [Trichonephila clavipes]